MRICLAVLVLSIAGGVAAQTPLPRGLQRLDYATDFDRATVAVPVHAEPIGIDPFPPSASVSDIDDPARRPIRMLVHGKGVRFRVRIPLG